MSTAIGFKCTSKLHELWSDKASIRNRNEFILEIMPEIAKRSQIIYGNPVKEPRYTSAGDAFSDTIMLALKDWNTYTDLETFLVHIFGYLKYYKYRHKFYEQNYLAYEYIILERLLARYALSITNLRELGEESFHPQSLVPLQQEETIAKLIGSLPTLDKEVLQMFVVDGWSKKEIAKHLDLSETEVDKHYRSSLKKARLAR